MKVRFYILAIVTFMLMDLAVDACYATYPSGGLALNEGTGIFLLCAVGTIGLTLFFWHLTDKIMDGLRQK